MSRTEAYPDLWTITVESTQEGVALFLEPLRRVQIILSRTPLANVVATATLLITGVLVVVYTATRQDPRIVFPAGIGTLAGVMLIREAVQTRRGLIAQVSFGAAGFILLMETALLLIPRT